MNRSFAEFERSQNYYREITGAEIPKEYRLTHATALLLWYCGIPRKGAFFAEIGCGIGFSMCWMAKTYRIQGIGIEKQSQLKESFERLAQKFEVAGQVSFLAKSAEEVSGACPGNSCDFVFSNPPHFETNRGKTYGELIRQTNRASEGQIYDSFCRAMAHLLKPRRYYYLVLSPQHLPEWMESLSRHRLTAKNLCVVHGRKGKPAELVLVKGLKEGNPGFLSIDAPVILKEE
ncbi:MAG TPA: methyltransferase domain-containing protein [Thermotogota bacterium]|nr:methyltransferase domain-containing protein [Thermotogota bacterium]